MGRVATLPGRIPSRAVRTSDYEDPSEGKLRAVLPLVWPWPQLTRLFIEHLGEPWLSGKLSGQGARAGPRQLEEVHRLSSQAAERLGVPLPEVFVKRSTAIEMTLLGTGGRSILVVTSAQLELAEVDELFYLIGRQMGHLKSGHVVALTLLQWMKDAIGSNLKNLAIPALLMAYRWQRAATFTADRAGLIVSQDLEGACRALLRVGLGRTGAAGVRDLRHYARTGLRDLLRHPLKSAPELLEPTPALPRRVAALYEFRASAPYAELFPPESPTSIV